MAEEPGKDGKRVGDELSPMARQYREMTPYVDAVWKLVGGAAFGVLAGYWLDKWLGTTPWLLVGLSTAGIVVGFYAFIRAMTRPSRKKQ
ncbi:MAG TPA: AtpZ/AtpI family protein [Myxococcaceae bacterium]|nr:AtpZ/AtpI family protein [Myxococcaceae bacterium]